MVTREDFGSYETAWCPGCGNFKLLDGVKAGLAEAHIEPRDALFVSGIGQAAKAPHYMNVNVFNGLHGRALPVATGAKIANPRLHVVVESGDGCCYGEGGNHFLAAIRRNIGVAMIVHDNQIYGLTKGQASPTTEEGQRTKAQPGGVLSERFDPLSIAVALRANFVARSFSGMPDHLARMIAAAIRHPGFALVDVLQPCVSFNKVNNFAWYKKRVTELGDDHDPTDHAAAMAAAAEWGDRIPIGVIWRGDREPFEERLPALAAGPLAGRPHDGAALARVMDVFR